MDLLVRCRSLFAGLHSSIDFLLLASCGQLVCIWKVLNLTDARQ